MTFNSSSIFRNLTTLPHPPGRSQNKILGEQLAKEWEEAMDKVETFKHNIYLSYPKKPGEIILHKDEANNETEKVLVINNEPEFDESEKNNNLLLYPFNAFSAAGTVTVNFYVVTLIRRLAS